MYIPQKVADRLRLYALQKCKGLAGRIFPISYEAARLIVNKAGKMVGIHLRPHDLRRHSATYASRSSVPIEIVSKVHPPTLKPVNCATVPWYNQRHRGDQVD